MVITLLAVYVRLIHDALSELCEVLILITLVSRRILVPGTHFAE